MKTVAGILVLVMIVTVVAVSGSRAQPLPGSSVAFQQCLEQALPSADRCAPAITLAAGADEFGGEHAMDQGVNHAGDFGQGQDLSSPDPDPWAQAILVGILLMIAERAIDWAWSRYVGGSAPADLAAYTSPVIFDPTR